MRAVGDKFPTQSGGRKAESSNHRLLDTQVPSALALGDEGFENVAFRVYRAADKSG